MASCEREGCLCGLFDITSNFPTQCILGSIEGMGSDMQTAGMSERFERLNIANHLLIGAILE